MTWEIDPTHSQVVFSVRHLAIATVKGQFKVISGHLHIDEEHPENSWVDAQADASSIDTRDAQRDGHLRSPDFFDAEKYPTINFKSSKVESTGGENYKVYGDLTMHGQTHPVTFNAEYAGKAKDPYGNQRAGFSITGKINRKEWGLSWNQALETGGVVVSEDVKIEIDLSSIYKA